MWIVDKRYRILYHQLLVLQELPVGPHIVHFQGSYGRVKCVKGNAFSLIDFHVYITTFNISAQNTNRHGYPSPKATPYHEDTTPSYVLFTCVCRVDRYDWTCWIWRCNSMEQCKLFSVGWEINVQWCATGDTHQNFSNILYLFIKSRVSFTFDLGRKVICVDPPPKSRIPTVLFVLEYKWPKANRQKVKHITLNIENSRECAIYHHCCEHRGYSMALCINCPFYWEFIPFTTTSVRMMHGYRYYHQPADLICGHQGGEDMFCLKTQGGFLNRCGGT